MTGLRTELRAALADVAGAGIDSHPADYGRCPTYSWHSGGEVPQWEREALDEARVRRLVSLIPARLPDGSAGAVLRLSVTGQEALSEKDSQIPPASGPTRRDQSGVGVRLGAGEPASAREGTL